MKSVCVVWKVPIQRLLEALEQSDEDTREEVHAVIHTPPYNTRKILELSNLEHDRLSLQNKSHFVGLLSKMVDLDAHGHMRCTAMKFNRGYELLAAEVEEVGKHEEVLESGHHDNWMRSVFEVEKNVVHYARVPGIYSTNPRVKRVMHMSVAECSIHF